MFKVCIDAGHGGYDSGAVGCGLKEKDLTLSVALKLNDLLLKDGRFETMMTRTGDYAPGHYENQLARELSERARISNDFGADLFISIHFNSSIDKGAFGCETIDAKNTGLAHNVAEALDQIINDKEGIKNRGVDDTDMYFAVIRETVAPAIITESCFITNQNDINHFATTDGQNRLAMYHYEAICKGFDIEPISDIPTQCVPEVNSVSLQSNSTVPTESLAPTVDSVTNAMAKAVESMQNVVPTNTVKPVAKVNFNGIDVVTHEELDQIIANYATNSSVSESVKSLSEDVSLCVKMSDLKQLVLEIMSQALSITVNHS